MDPSLRTLQLQTLLAQTSVGIAASDIEGRLTLLSPALQELFDQPFEPIGEAELGPRFQLYDESGTAPLALEDVPLVRARAGEVVRDQVVTARIGSRGLVYLRCNAAPLRSGEEILGAIGLVQDVTAEHAALARQGELRERLVDT